MKAQLNFRTYLVAKASKARHYVTLAPVDYDRDLAKQLYGELRSSGRVNRRDVAWAREIARRALRLEKHPDFFTSEGQHKMEASNRASGGTLKSFVMHLAAADLSGYEVCPGASEGCRKSCLVSSGHGSTCGVTAGRIKRTRLYFEHREIFALTLYGLLKNLSKRKEQIAIRLNGTSDIWWEKKEPWIFESFPDHVFYDYSKLHGRFKPSLPKNYHLTFSRSEDRSNHVQATKLLDKGYNVAMVFDFPIYKAITQAGQWCGYPVVDGAADDRRFLDPKGSIVALKPLGKAKQASSGFVIRNSLRAIGGIL